MIRLPKPDRLQADPIAGSAAVLTPLAERWRCVLELTGQWYWEQDDAYRFTLVDGAGAQAAPFDMTGLLGKTLWQAPASAITDEDGWEPHQAALQARAPFTDLLVRYAEPGAAPVFVKFSGQPVFDRAQRFCGYRGVALDVTASTYDVELLRLEHLVARSLAGASDAPMALKAVMRALCETHGWQCGRYFVLDRQAGVLRFDQSWSVPDAQVERFIAGSRAVVFAPGVGLTGRVWESGQPIWVADVRSDERIHSKDLHRNASTRATFGFPVKVDGQTVGVMGFNSRQIREPDERLLQTVQTIGGQIGQFLQRKQAEETLQRLRVAHDEHASMLIREAQTGLLIVQDGKLRFVNPFLAGLFGQPVEELVGLGAFDIVAPADRARVHEQTTLRLQGKAGAPYDIRCQRKDGTIFDARVCGRRIEFDGAPADLVTMLDITERRRLESELERKNTVLSTKLETSLDGILLLDENGRTLSCNRTFLAMWGLGDAAQACADASHASRSADSADAADAADPLKTVSTQTTDPRTFGARVQYLDAHKTEKSREEIQTHDGRIIDQFTAPVIGPNGEYFGRVWHFRDITEAHRADVSLRRANRALRVISAANKALIRGESEEKLLQTACKLLLDPGGYHMAWIGFLDLQNSQTVHPVAHSDSQEGPLKRRAALESEAFLLGGAVGSDDPTTAAARTGTVQIRRNLAGGPLAGADTGQAQGYACVIGLPLCGESGTLGVLTIQSTEPDAFDEGEVGLLQELADNLAFGIVVHRSNLEHSRAVARAERLAHFDALTELPNRVLLLEDTANVLRSAGDQAEGFSILDIDVPHIEFLKTNMGFGASDTLAMTIAARLRDVCTDAEMAARLEGSEFAVRLDPDASGSAEAVIARTQVIRAALQQPAMIGPAEVVPQCLIGIAMYPTDATDASTLLERAQTARINASAGNEICFFGPQKSADAMRGLALESALRHASARGELALVYQPEVDLRSGRIVAVEALLRWNSSQFGAISPVEFIPLAERSDLILSIGEWVLREACRQAVAWRAADLAAPRIAVNLSSRQLGEPGSAALIQSIVLECGCNPAWLGLEITESMIIEDSHYTAQVLRELKAIGFEIYLDDFGTGYSSLGRLNEMPIDIVKIDRSFVPDVTAAMEDVSITRAIITMAHSLQLRVLAEGVETEGQLGLLAANGCDLIQGYLFSKPVGPDAIEAMIREDHCLPEKFTTRAKGVRTLLLVDDEANILSSLKRLLRRDGYQIVCAANAAEGLLRLADSPVDVILSDQRMPGMTGVEFLRRAKELYPGTVRMVLSGFTELQSVIDAVNEGAIYKFLTKPWDDNRLREHVAEAFRQKELADENRRLASEIEQANASYASLNLKLQDSLARQSHNADVLERSASGARQILESVPAAVLGVDADGLIVYVNEPAAQVLPQGLAAIGSLASNALPQPLLQMLDAPDAAPRLIQMGAQRCYAAIQPMHTKGQVNGRLIVVLALPPAPPEIES